MVWSGSGREDPPRGEGVADTNNRSVKVLSQKVAGSGSGLSARGTQDGLILRADGRKDREELWEELRGFIQSRRSFVEGNQVVIEWVGQLPADDTLSFVRVNVLRDFDIDLVSAGCVEPYRPELYKSGPAGFSEVGAVVGGNEGSIYLGDRMNNSGDEMDTTDPRSGAGLETGLGSGTRSSNLGGQILGGQKPSLFGGIEAALDRRAGESQGSRAGGKDSWNDSQQEGDPVEARTSGARLGATPKLGWGAAVANWDDADARVVYGTLRSGQKVETEHSVLVFGDVNSGAEVVAGGDVIVLGNLRGVAHAGAYDETGGGRVIFALHLEPTQLRIGAVISRGMGGGSTPEIARVDGQGIVVEPYQAKGAPSGRRAA